MRHTRLVSTIPLAVAQAGIAAWRLARAIQHLQSSTPIPAMLMRTATILKFPMMEETGRPPLEAGESRPFREAYTAPS